MRFSGTKHFLSLVTFDRYRRTVPKGFWTTSSFGNPGTCVRNMAKKGSCFQDLNFCERDVRRRRALITFSRITLMGGKFQVRLTRALRVSPVARPQPEGQENLVSVGDHTGCCNRLALRCLTSHETRLLLVAQGGLCFSEATIVSLIGI